MGDIWDVMKGLKSEMNRKQHQSTPYAYMYITYAYLPKEKLLSFF